MTKAELLASYDRQEMKLNKRYDFLMQSNPESEDLVDIMEYNMHLDEARKMLDSGKYDNVDIPEEYTDAALFALEEMEDKVNEQDFEMEER